MDLENQKKTPQIQKAISQWVGIGSLSPDATEQEQRLYKQKIAQLVSRKLMWWGLFTLPILLLTFWIGTKFPENKPMNHQKEGTKASEKKIKFWSCSMHPQIQQPGEGKCPLCFMDLIPVYEGGGDENEEGAVLFLSERAQKLAEVKTEPVLYRKLIHSISMVGKVDYDETRVANISLWTPGRSRLEKMFVSFTGAWVKKGDPLLEVYSPDLIGAQGEYLSAYNSWKNAQEENSLVSRSFSQNIKAAQRKLLDLGMTKGQIEKLEKENKPDQTTIIYAPVSGTVIDKLVNEGEWHGRGMSIYRIADLSHVWVKLDAYESDMSWIRYAQKVSFATEAYPGKSFQGRIAFIDPFLNEMTRTIKLRVNAPNSKGHLRPGMFVRATLKVNVAEGGKVIDEHLEGKWICPIHPEVIVDEPGECNSYLGIDSKVLCQRPLVFSQKLNFTEANALRDRVLAIPRSAPLITGKRAVVYVEEEKPIYDDEGKKIGKKLRYEGKEVVLGQRAGDYYIVLSGLEEGERVVTQGAFKIDSALQIVAKPSMMNPIKVESEEEKGKEKSTPNQVAPFAIANSPYHNKMTSVLEAYLSIVKDLSQDNDKNIMVHIGQALKSIEEISLESSPLPPVSRRELQEILANIRENFHQLHKGQNIEQIRQGLDSLSKAISSYLDNFGHGLNGTIYQAYCPMANDSKGGDWWQRSEKIANPYFGEEMLFCGEIKRNHPVLPSQHIGSAVFQTGNYWQATASYHTQSKTILAAYLKMGELMSLDQVEGVQVQRDAILLAIEQIQSEKAISDPKARDTMSRHLGTLKRLLAAMQGNDLKQLRRDYLDISSTLIEYVKDFGHMYPETLKIGYCSMYRNDLGGSWLQTEKRIRNPFFGSEMYRCGSFKKKIPMISSNEVNHSEKESPSKNKSKNDPKNNQHIHKSEQGE